MTWTNQIKSETGLTWDMATFTWNAAVGTWQDPYEWANQTPHASSWGNKTKDVSTFANQTKH